jgi:alpha-L-fucosidase
MIKIHPAMTVFCGLLFAEAPVIAADYQSTWASVDQHTPAPEWFKDAKWGLWFHWGVFCTPTYGSEWYPRNMYNSGSNENNHHNDVYGDPNGDWGYQNFLLGKNDKQGKWTQFAPKLASSGGNFDPDEWARLFDSAGAKIAGPVAEHHDGIAMWASKVNPWNVKDKGPKMDLVKVLTDAFRAKGMKVMCSLHHAWNFNGYYQYVPSQTDTGLQRLFGQMGQAKEEQYWLDQLKEVIDGYKPDYIWQDFSVASITESVRTDFLSYYFNKEAEWGKEVVASYNDGMNSYGEVHQYERGGPGDITTPYFMSEDAISYTTWGYTQGMQYYTPKQMLHELLDVASKNGTLILNISPMPDGTIPQEQRTILLSIGDWLHKFGSSVYGTRIWSTYGEGPTKMGGSSFVAPSEGTGSDIRYTKAKNNSAVYAIMLGWPGNGTTVTMAGLNSSKLHLTAQTKVQLIGSTPGTDVTLVYSQDANGLNVTFPASQPYTALAYPVRVLLTSDTSVGLSYVSVYQNYNYDGLEAQLPVGSYTKSQLVALGVTDNDISSMQVDTGLMVELFDDDNFQTPLGTFTSDQPNFGNLGINDKVTSLRISKTTTSIRNLSVATAGRLRWSEGTLFLPGTESGKLQIVDFQGRSRIVDVAGGRAAIGRLPAGVYQAKVLDGKSSAYRFIVAP